EVVGDDQDRAHAHVLELLHEQPGLGGLDADLVDDRDTVFAGQLREDRTDAGPIHLLVQLVAEVLFRRAREGPATATPQRAGGHARASATGALLAPRLLGRVPDFRPGLLLAVAAAGVRLEGDDHLVNQRFVVFAPENGIEGIDLRCRPTLGVEKLEFHRHSPSGRLRRRLDGGPDDDITVL